VRDIFAKIWGTVPTSSRFPLVCSSNKERVVSQSLPFRPLSVPAPDLLSENLLMRNEDGGTLAFPTPDEPNHGKAPWPHVGQET
jgi:hypothetical protein